MISMPRSLVTRPMAANAITRARVKDYLSTQPPHTWPPPPPPRMRGFLFV